MTTYCVWYSVHARPHINTARRVRGTCISLAETSTLIHIGRLYAEKVRLSDLIFAYALGPYIPSTRDLGWQVKLAGFNRTAAYGVIHHARFDLVRCSSHPPSCPIPSFTPSHVMNLVPVHDPTLMGPDQYSTV